IVLWIVLPLSLMGYTFYTFSAPKYLVVAAPSAICAVLLGVTALEQAFPRQRTFVTTFLVSSIVTLTVTQLPQVNRFAEGPPELMSAAGKVERAMTELPYKPAVVLFRWS